MCTENILPRRATSSALREKGVIAKGRDHSDTVNCFWVGFLPRSRSPATFFVAAACYIIAWKAVAPTMVALLGLWPTAMDPVTHAMKPVRLGITDDLANRSLLLRAVVSLLFTPIVESLVVIGLIALLRRLRCTTLIQVAASAAAVSFLHSLSYPIWGILTLPCFLIGAAAYVYWRRTSFYLGAAMIMALHLISNLTPVLNEAARQMHR